MSNFPESSNSASSLFDKKTKRKLPFVVQRPPFEIPNTYNRKSHWTEKENLKYVCFLRYFREIFVSHQQNHFSPIFKIMAQFMKTRTLSQCRTHHQKKMVKQEATQNNNRIDQVINAMAWKHKPKQFEEHYENYQIQLENLDISQTEKKVIRQNRNSHRKGKKKKRNQNLMGEHSDEELSQLEQQSEKVESLLENSPFQKSPLEKSPLDKSISQQPIKAKIEAQEETFKKTNKKTKQSQAEQEEYFPTKIENKVQSKPYQEQSIQMEEKARQSHQQASISQVVRPKMLDAQVQVKIEDIDTTLSWLGVQELRLINQLNNLQMMSFRNRDLYHGMSWPNLQMQRKKAELVNLINHVRYRIHYETSQIKIKQERLEETRRRIQSFQNNNYSSIEGPNSYSSELSMQNRQSFHPRRHM